MNAQTLSDRAEIADLIALYCRGVDRMHEPTLRALYHEDAIEDRGSGLFIGNAHQWIDWTMSLLPALALTQHCILNSLIVFDGDAASGETYFHAYHRFGAPNSAVARDAIIATVPIPDDVRWLEGGTEMMLGGRYLDRFERRAGRWKFAYRKMVCDWCRTLPVAEGWFDANPTAYRAVRHIDDTALGSALHPLQRG